MQRCVDEPQPDGRDTVNEATITNKRQSPITHARKAALAFRRAVKFEDLGDDAKSDEWLSKAAMYESRAAAAGEVLPIEGI